jgi:hypothetical protein
MVTVHAPLPKACLEAIELITQVRQEIGTSAGYEQQIADLLSDFQIQLTLDNQLKAAKLGQKITDLTMSNSGLSSDIGQDLEVLAAATKECTS